MKSAATREALAFLAECQLPSVQEAHLSSEMQLAVNYMLLSACFLVMTTFFNLKIIDQVDQIPRGKVTSGHRPTSCKRAELGAAIESLRRRNPFEEESSELKLRFFRYNCVSQAGTMMRLKTFSSLAGESV
ncbi:hypothetical protein COOONC_06185 [Cooperia oncophora]